MHKKEAESVFYVVLQICFVCLCVFFHSFLYGSFSSKTIELRVMELNRRYLLQQSAFSERSFARGGGGLVGSELKETASTAEDS